MNVKTIAIEDRQEDVVKSVMETYGIESFSKATRFIIDKYAKDMLSDEKESKVKNKIEQNGYDKADFEIEGL
ncbi:hypothetical protein ACFY6E_12475 [Staphylococcus cohnii]|uniref:hypothetical protein n=1 Tax=Staphylococcus cohnii TaxID=29382 RepID=UPI0036B9C82C